MPANWRGTERFRLFISHIATEKDKATRLKTCLAPYGIDAFVAHEDIEPTLEWQTEIEKALRAMDAFLAIHTMGFAAFASGFGFVRGESDFSTAC